MEESTVAQLATELVMPVGLLLELLQAAGVPKQQESDSISEQDKAQLLEYLPSTYFSGHRRAQVSVGALTLLQYLKRTHGSGSAKNKKITLNRSETTEIKKTDSTGKAGIIQVEVYKKRVVAPITAVQIEQPVAVVAKATPAQAATAMNVRGGYIEHGNTIEARNESTNKLKPSTKNMMDSDKGLFERCQKITGRILDEIVIPWKQAIASYSAGDDHVTLNSKRSQEKIAATIKNNDELLSSVFSRLGRNFPNPAQAVLVELERIKAQPSQAIPEENVNRLHLHENYNAAMRCKEVGADRIEFLVGVLKAYGIWVFVGSLIVFWYIFNFEVGFYLALAATVAVPLRFEHVYTSNAKKYCEAMVKAVAINRYYLLKEADSVLLENETAIREMKKSFSIFIKDKEPLAKILNEEIRSIYATGFEVASTSDTSAWAAWSPASNHVGWVRIGEQSISVAALPDGLRKFANETDIMQGFRIPALALFKNGKSIVFEILNQEQLIRCNKAVQNIIFRILATTPPAKVLFTFIDPIGQGQNVASFLALSDYNESLVNIKAWTDSRQIEQRLTELTEHMEMVIQKRLRTDYKTIDDYNTAAGEIAEAYRVVVIFDFPENISENAAKQLKRIVDNGARCGIYAIIVANMNKLEDQFSSQGMLGNIVTHSLMIKGGGGSHGCEYSWHSHQAVTLKMDFTPPDNLIKRVVKAVGEKSKNTKVEVPYSKLLQLAGIDVSRIWSESTADGIRIPIGPGDARKPRFLELGVGLSQHALVVGRPGSGKSNLMHVVITTAARMYSPQELKLYLIDFKKGVEFKSYANAALPHAYVIALESEREFGLSVLRKLDEELTERSNKFKALKSSKGLDVTSISEFREKTKVELPRILLLVDEFQEFFVKQDALADEAARLFDRIVRQGRAFGVHLFLASQSLAGNNTLPKATLNLITVRIALQSSESDSRIILAEDNMAARLLSRPGEGIYNSSSGLVEGNNLFQVALFKDEDRTEVLSLLAERIRHPQKLKNGSWEEFSQPLIFEGHESAILEKSIPLSSLLDAPDWPEKSRAFEIWLGEPIEIRPPTGMKVAKRSGSHLLVVTKDEEEAVGVLTAAVISLVAQLRPGTAEISILDLTTADAKWADVPEQMEELFNMHKIKVLGRKCLQDILDKLSSLVKQRTASEQKADVAHYFVLLGLHRARDLRREEYSSRFDSDSEAKPDLATQFASILRDGPECGVHVFTWCDTCANLDRSLDHQLLAEFGTRIVGSMSNSDSRRLIDDDAASQIEHPHRLIKYDEDHVGVLEMFRPYALPSAAWMESVAAKLKNRSTN